MNKLAILIYTLGMTLAFVVCFGLTLKVEMSGLDWLATAFTIASLAWYYYMLISELDLDLDRDDMPKAFYPPNNSNNK